jgi:hypothetical protein
MGCLSRRPAESELDLQSYAGPKNLAMRAEPWKSRDSPDARFGFTYDTVGKRGARVYTRTNF